MVHGLLGQAGVPRAAVNPDVVARCLQVRVVYALPDPADTAAHLANDLLADTVADRRAAALFVNHDELKSLYEPGAPADSPPGATLEVHDYVIVTTADLAGAITASDFPDWKSSLGFDVRVVLTTDPHFKLMEEEIFGPVLTIYVYPDVEYGSILELCDSTSPYGLTGAVFARDRYAVLAAHRRLRYAAGNFYVNDKPTGAMVGLQPFGGSRHGLPLMGIGARHDETIKIQLRQTGPQGRHPVGKGRAMRPRLPRKGRPRLLQSIGQIGGRIGRQCFGLLGNRGHGLFTRRRSRRSEVGSPTPP